MRSFTALRTHTVCFFPQLNLLFSWMYRWGNGCAWKAQGSGSLRVQLPETRTADANAIPRFDASEVSETETGSLSNSKEDGGRCRFGWGSGQLMSPWWGSSNFYTIYLPIKEVFFLVSVQVLTRPNWKGKMAVWGHTVMAGTGCPANTVAALCREEAKKSPRPGALAFVPDQWRKEIHGTSVALQSDP